MLFASSCSGTARPRRTFASGSSRRCAWSWSWSELVLAVAWLVSRTCLVTALSPPPLTAPPRRSLVTAKMCEGNRAAMDALALRRRPYLGTTAMDTELALLMANQALARPGALALDPFVGTGSIVVPLAVQGAFALGIEIDSRVVRGTGKSLSNNQRAAHRRTCACAH
eukprot:Unigene7897_Nuclearia_a/m.24246 Unigene7897_Nuclearia_a/g.24246  ORF Unigene7897_Nuclearia_a/g.24246 Unigene7897_Nuclearia_a/m.24246 type:complete len:168 (-) Unigene7897_Nuclearia_a:756-1259(-)